MVAPTAAQLVARTLKALRRNISNWVDRNATTLTIITNCL